MPVLQHAQLLSAAAAACLKKFRGPQEPAYMFSAILSRHKNLLIRKDEDKRIKDENKDPLSFRLILYPSAFNTLPRVFSAAGRPPAAAWSPLSPTPRVLRRLSDLPASRAFSHRPRDRDL